MEEPRGPNPSFLVSINPEVFVIKPRSGGVVGRPEPKAEEDEFKTPPNKTVSRQFRVDRSLEVTGNMPPQDQIDEMKIKLTSAALSCVMMMAAECNTIPQESTEVTKRYLCHVMDEFGHAPPNIQGVLNHIEWREANAQGDVGENPDENNETVYEDAGEGAVGEEEEGDEPAEGGDGVPEVGKTVRATTRVKIGNRGGVL